MEHAIKIKGTLDEMVDFFANFNVRFYEQVQLGVYSIVIRTSEDFKLNKNIKSFKSLIKSMIKQNQYFSDEYKARLEDIEINGKTLEDRNCYMQFEWNNVLEAWNGYLTKKEDDPDSLDGINNSIKCFVYNTKEESKKAARKWANSNPRKLHNYKTR